MKQEYNYFKQVQYLDSISIDDIGNFVLEAFTDDGEKYYLMIRTVLGVSRIFQIGPIQDGVHLFCSSYFQQTDYDDRKIDSIIRKFVNGKISLTQIMVYSVKTKDDMLKFTKTLPDIKEFLYD